MDSWSNRAASWDVEVNAARVMFDALTISMGLDQLTTVATFDLVDQPALPAAGDPVQVDWVNLGTDRAITVFSGRVYAVDAESYPHRVGVIAQGPLGVLTTCLRQRSDGDLNLTGMTDGAAVEAILTYCGVPFDPDDIDDAGYELGEREDVRWHADGQTAAATILGEIDRVFFSKLLDIGPGRVIRGFYDLASEATSGVRNYVRGADKRLFANRKASGEITAIQNQWQVTGPTIDCGDEESGCSCTPLANGHTDNAILETWTGVDHARAALQTFQSDLIQDEALAAAVATRLMAWYNRIPITLDVEVQSEPQLYPCRIVTVRDNSYGIDLDAATAFTISRVEMRPDSTSLQLVGGPPGSTGTITSSVEELCNETEDAQDWPGDFESPDFSDFPNLDDGDFTPFPDLPWGDVPPVEVPNVTDPYFCTEAEDGGSIAPAVAGCHTYASLTSLNHRLSGSGTPCFHADEQGEIDEIRFYGTLPNDLTVNLTTPLASKTTSNDLLVGNAPIVVVSFEIMYHVLDAESTVIVQVPALTDIALVQMFADPGTTYPNVGAPEAVINPGVLMHTENQGPRLSGTVGEGVCISFALQCNDGGVRLDGGYPLDTWHSVSFAFDLSGWPQRIIYGGPDGGIKQDVVCWGPSGEFCFADGTCDDTEHEIIVRVNPTVSGMGTTADDPAVRIRHLVVGYADCVENPDFNPDAGDDDA